MDKEPVKALHWIWNEQKMYTTKKLKEVVEKDMIVRGLKRTGGQNHLLWRLGFKNRLSPACWDNPTCFRKVKEEKPHF